MDQVTEKWLGGKWRLITDDATILKAYYVTFTSPEGALILQHLMDNIYCKVYEGIDPMAALAHNAKRSVIHEILENMDRAANPGKYRVAAIVEQEKEHLA